MRVYVETNFVLECVLGQEQSQSCTAILTLATDGLIELVIPAFSVIEPYQRLTRRKRDRTDLKLRLDRERSEIARVSQYQSRLTELDQLSDFLLGSSDREGTRMEEMRSALLGTARICDLRLATLLDATKHSSSLGLTPEDAVVLATVVGDLSDFPVERSLFITRNSKDFKDPEVTQQLSELGCETIFDFDAGYARIQDALTKG